MGVLQPADEDRRVHPQVALVVSSGHFLRLRIELNLYFMAAMGDDDAMPPGEENIMFYTRIPLHIEFNRLCVVSFVCVCACRPTCLCGCVFVCECTRVCMCLYVFVCVCV